MDHVFMIPLWKPLEVLFLRKPLNRCFQISLSKVVDSLYSWNIRVKILPRKSQFVKILDVFITKTEVMVNSLWGEWFCSPWFRLLPCTNKQHPGCEIRTWKRFNIFLGAKRVSHSIEEPRVSTALGRFCKFQPSQNLHIAFHVIEKG